MVELNHRERTIKIKIVYYGPAVGGKTTNLQVLHQHAQATRRGEMISVNSAQDRTILFDLLPLKAAGFRGFDLRLQVLAVPGQAMYAATRRLVLKGADSVVFVANSAADRLEENLQSFREMTQNLLAHQLDPASLPLVLQYNKRDLPSVTPIDFMDRTLNARRVDSMQAVAVRGEGVLETFSAVLLRTMQDLAQRYQIVDASRGQSLPTWTQQTILGMFGTTSLAPEPHPLPLEPPPAGVGAGPPAPPAPPVAPADRRTVRVTLPEETPRTSGAGPNVRAAETLVESYAQASAELSSAVTELREERDQARRHLEDVQQALAAGQDVLSGAPLEPTLRTVLARMAESAGTPHASFLLVEADRSLTAAVFRGVAADPLLRVPVSGRHVLTRFLGEGEPRLHQAADSLDLGDALEGASPPFAAVVSVPVRTPRGLQGLALLYYTADAALPRGETLTHLGVMSRALSAPLELARAIETVRAAERTLQMALAGTASLQGLGGVVASLGELRDRLGEMRRRSDAPPWLLEESARIAPSLAGALSTARSLLDFSRGEIQREAVGVEELMADLPVQTVAVHLGPGVNAVYGDAVLLRLALNALVNHARAAGTAGDAAPPVQVRAVADGGRILISVGQTADVRPQPAGGPGIPPAKGGADVNLSLVRRIAELHGGSLTLDAGEEPGTRYTLHLVPV